MTMEPSPLLDMHCHLGFASNAAQLARELGGQGGALCATVSPSEYEALRDGLSGMPSVKVGLGLHPWWLHDGRCTERDVQRCVELAEGAPFIAEVGLDFGKRCVSSRDIQRRAFERICAVAAQTGGKVLSLHAVSSVDVVLEILERAGVVGRAESSCAVILHWYSGSSDALQHAVRLGCFFSINPRMLQTKRGREYARILPEERLLLETDLPPSAGGSFSAAEFAGTLVRTLSDLEALRGASLGARIAATSRALLNWNSEAAAPARLPR